MVALDINEILQQMLIAPQIVETPRENTTTTRRSAKHSSKELHAENLDIAYVVHNADGSFTQVKTSKTTITTVWTTVVEETRSNNNFVTDVRLAPLNDWKNPPDNLKRNVYKQATPIEPNECLSRCLQQNPMDNPVLLVCWEKPPPPPDKNEDPSKHKHNKHVCSRRKEWHLFLFTNGTDTSRTDGRPIILVHTVSGVRQLDEDGIQSVGSAAFINWLTNKVQCHKWEIISLTRDSASVRVKLFVGDKEEV